MHPVVVCIALSSSWASLGPPANMVVVYQVASQLASSILEDVTTNSFFLFFFYQLRPVGQLGQAYSTGTHHCDAVYWTRI